MKASQAPRANPAAAEEFASRLLKESPGSCIELRAWGAKIGGNRNLVLPSDGRSTVGGWFTRPDEFYVAVSQCEGVSCYMTVNPVPKSGRPDRLRDKIGYFKKGECVTDKDMKILNWMIIDIDPVVPGGRKGANSTAEELESCMSLAHRIVSDVEEFKSSDNYIGISGNGSFIMTRLGVPNTPEVVCDIRAFVSHLSSRFKGGTAEIDPLSGLPSKLLAVPGSIKRKGKAHTADRPWRMVEFVSVPS